MSESPAAAKIMINVILDSLDKLKDKCWGFEYEHLACALKKISEGEDANIAFGLKSAGRGNKITAEQEQYERIVALKVYDLLSETKGNVSKACEYLSKNMHSLLPNEYAKYTSAGAVRKIYYKYFLYKIFKEFEEFGVYPPDYDRRMYYKSAASKASTSKKSKNVK